MKDDLMDLKDERVDYFEEFKAGKKSVYVLPGFDAPGFPPFTFRKIDDRHLAILAWRSKAEAEQWVIKMKGEPSGVIEVSYAELMNELGKLTAERREGITIELI